MLYDFISILGEPRVWNRWIFTYLYIIHKVIVMGKRLGEVGLIVLSNVTITVKEINNIFTQSILWDLQRAPKNLVWLTGNREPNNHEAFKWVSTSLTLNLRTLKKHNYRFTGTNELNLGFTSNHGFNLEFRGTQEAYHGFTGTNDPNLWV